MSDYMVRAAAADAQIRAFAVTGRELVEKARQAHETSPVMTAALGRLLMGGVMMGAMLKGEQDILTLQIRGDGPGKGLTVTADSQGNVKGYPQVPGVILPPNAQGKLDVAGAMGSGSLRVIKDMGMKDPYVGQTQLQTGEIAEDLTYYFAVSEQVPSCVGLGVLMERDNTVKQAGGFIVQLMPHAQESTVAALESNLARVSSVTGLLEEGKNPERILALLLEGLEPEITDRRQVQFACNCDRGRVEKALISIGKGELEDMIREGRDVEVNCHFCNTRYVFTPEQIRELYRKSLSRE